MTRRHLHYATIVVVLGGIVMGGYFALKPVPAVDEASRPSPGTAGTQPGAGHGIAILQEPTLRTVAASPALNAKPDPDPVKTLVPERPSPESVQRKYAHATDGEIKFAHETLSKELHKLVDEHLAEEIRRGHYELVELPRGESLPPATSRTESFRVESFPDDHKGVTTYKIARCEPEKLPEAADYVVELKWLAQEIDSRKLWDH